MYFFKVTVYSDLFSNFLLYLSSYVGRCTLKLVSTKTELSERKPLLSREYISVYMLFMQQCRNNFVKRQYYWYK